MGLWRVIILSLTITSHAWLVKDFSRPRALSRALSILKQYKLDGNFIHLYEKHTPPYSLMHTKYYEPFTASEERKIRKALESVKGPNGNDFMNAKRLLMMNTRPKINYEMSDALITPMRWFHHPNIAHVTLGRIDRITMLQLIDSLHQGRPVPNLRAQPAPLFAHGIIYMRKIDFNDPEEISRLKYWLHNAVTQRRQFCLWRQADGQLHDIHNHFIGWFDDSSVMSLSEFSYNRIHEIASITTQYDQKIRKSLIEHLAYISGLTERGNMFLKDRLLPSLGEGGSLNQASESYDDITMEAAGKIKAVIHDWHQDLLFTRTIIGKIIERLQSAYWSKNKSLCLIGEEAVNLWGDFARLMPHDGLRTASVIREKVLGLRSMRGAQAEQHLDRTLNPSPQQSRHPAPGSARNFIITRTPENRYRRRVGVVSHAVGVGASAGLFDGLEKFGSTLLFPAYLGVTDELEIDLDSYRYTTDASDPPAFGESSKFCPYGRASDVEQLADMITWLWLDKVTVAQQIFGGPKWHDNYQGKFGPGKLSSTLYLITKFNLTNHSPWRELAEFRKLIPQFLTNLNMSKGMDRIMHMHDLRLDHLIVSKHCQDRLTDLTYLAKSSKEEGAPDQDLVYAALSKRTSHIWGQSRVFNDTCWEREKDTLPESWKETANSMAEPDLQKLLKGTEPPRDLYFMRRQPVTSTKPPLTRKIEMFYPRQYIHAFDDWLKEWDSLLIKMHALESSLTKTC